MYICVYTYFINSWDYRYFRFKPKYLVFLLVMNWFMWIVAEAVTTKYVATEIVNNWIKSISPLESDK